MDEKKKVDLISKYKFLWFGLTLAFFLPLVGLIIFETSLSPATQNIAYVKAGTFTQLEGRDVKGLEMVRLTFTEDVKGSNIRLEADETIPFAGISYSKFRLYSDDESLSQKIGEVKFNLDLTQEELNDLGLSEESLYLYHNGKKLTLEKRAIVKQEGHLYYKATSFGIGNFVIGKEAEPELKEKTAVATEISEEEASPKPEEESEEPEDTQEEISPEVEQPRALPGREETVDGTKKGFFTRLKDFFKGLFS